MRPHTIHSEGGVGAQFHPEVLPARIREWRVDGFDPEEVYAGAVADEPVSTPIWHEAVRSVRGTADTDPTLAH
ncbi:hypothetical protein ACIBO2_41640 [Nonomuraea sp. NPDC050022]|uniref:hypothetical protein n=1 Tax=Nonomuraea sp. NPDC050022 TaxID=3364358 RepID=UPI00379AF2FB